MPPDLPARARAAAETAAAELEGATGDAVVVVGPVSSEEEGQAAGRELAAAGPYAIVVVPTIATMAAYPWAALASIDLPVLVWSRTEPHAALEDTVALVRGSAPVGATAIGNVLAREGRVFRAANGPALPARALV